jgi:hypothetical protein
MVKAGAVLGRDADWCRSSEPLLLGQRVFWTKLGWMTPVRGTRIDAGERVELWLGNAATL